MTNLTGSTKQIAWADKIRDEMIAKAVYWWQGKADEFRSQPGAQELYDSVITTIKAIPSAAWFIDNRAHGHNDMMRAIGAQGLILGTIAKKDV